MAGQSTVRSSNRTFLVAGAALLSVAAAFVVLKTIERKRQNDAASKGSASGRPHDEAVNAQLAILFEAATRESKELENISNTEKLILYSLYKQSREGDAPDKSLAFSINLVEKAKHGAWCRVRGMKKSIAMLHYIEAVHKLRTSGSMDDGDVVSGDLLDSDGLDVLDDLSGMGNKPSSLANNEEDIGDGYNGQELTTAQEFLRAASQNNTNELRSLLQQNPHLVNHRDEDGQSPLHLAADKGAIEALQVLIEAGADFNAADADGISVLQAAVIAENLRACQLLLDKGANPDQADDDGDTPRKCAEDGSDEMQKLFAS